MKKLISKETDKKRIWLFYQKGRFPKVYIKEVPF